MTREASKPTKTPRSVFIISQPDYDSENIDSVWLSRRAALRRAAELGTPFIQEFALGKPDAWLTNGWFNPKGPQVWSDFGHPDRNKV